MGAKPESTAEPMIQSKVLGRILDASAITDETRRNLLESEHLDQGALKKLGALVPLRAYLRLFDRLANWMNRPALGLHLSASIGPDLVGAIGYLFLNSSTLDAALTAYSNGVFSIQGVTELAYRRAPLPMLSYVITDETMQPRRQDVEFSLGHVHALIRRYLGPHYSPVEVHFEHPLVGRLATYDDVFGCAVHFEQPRNALLLRQEDLQRTSHSADPGLASVLRHYLQLVDLRGQTPVRWADRVRSLLAMNDVTEPLSARQIAGRLGLGTHALQRRLSAEGTSVRKLALQRRIAVAQRYLLDTDLSILAIANLLGYAETASFDHAFRSSCGESPRQFRQRAPSERPDPS